MKRFFASILLVSASVAMAQTPARPSVAAPTRPAPGRAAARAAEPASGATVPASLAGIYQTIPNDETLPGGLKNSGGPREVSLQPSAVEAIKTVDLSEEAAKLCLPVGPFRMMARDGVKIELVLKPETIFMLFEDVSHGYLRTIHMDRGQKRAKNSEPTWMGDSTGRWAGGALVVDTVGFNDRTWLNETGAPHSEALHLVERIRPILRGTVLEYTVTANDPKALTKPYTYIRYFRKLEVDALMEDFCEAELN
jgi:hypothetical protein